MIFLYGQNDIFQLKALTQLIVSFENILHVCRLSQKQQLLNTILLFRTVLTADLHQYTYNTCLEIENIFSYHRESL